MLAALLVTVIVGPMHIACAIGAFVYRLSPAFAVRVPAGVLGSMFTKLAGFLLMAWLLLDPYECPCVVVPFMFWVDWTGNCWYVAKTVFLLFRYEIQAALKRSKEESNVVPFDEKKNFFVRYRQILRSGTQFWIMIAVLSYIFIGNMIVLGVGISADLALKPCTYSIWLENPMCLGCLLFAWVTAGPMMVTSTWASARLKKFPHDNWKMGTENTITSVFTTLGAISCATVLILVPTFDGILWVLFLGSLGGQLLQFLMPVTLHYRTVSQLAKLDLNRFTSLDSLLQNDEFLESFGYFLRKEFSSENLFFWLEVNRLKDEYDSLIPDESKSADVEETPERVALLTRAARDCTILGSRCVGDTAPWQLNVSGFTAQAMGTALQRVEELTSSGSTEGLCAAVQEALQTLVLMQHETYELLRKDPYPRFLLTKEADKLNQNGNFKRMLAAEKLEEEVQKSLGSPKRPTVAEGGSNDKHSDSSKKSSEHKKHQRPSQMLTFLNGLTPDNSNRASDVKSPTAIEMRAGSSQTDSTLSDGRRPSDNESPRIAISVEN